MFARSVALLLLPSCPHISLTIIVIMIRTCTHNPFCTSVHEQEVNRLWGSLRERIAQHGLRYTKSSNLTFNGFI